MVCFLGRHTKGTLIAAESMKIYTEPIKCLSLPPVNITAMKSTGKIFCAAATVAAYSTPLAWAKNFQSTYSVMYRIFLNFPRTW